MIEQIYNYFTIEMLYYWVNLGVLPFWLILIFFTQSYLCRFFVTSIFDSKQLLQHNSLNYKIHLMLFYRETQEILYF